MKFIREYRTTLQGEYVYDFEVTGICTDSDPLAFSLIKTADGYLPIDETSFYDLWNYADNCEMEIEVTTKFQYLRMTRLKKGVFVFVISGVAAADAATLVLRFSEYISRDYCS